MEKHQSPQWTRTRKEERRPLSYEPQTSPRLDESVRRDGQVDIRTIVEGHLREKAKSETRRKWTGRGLMVGGILTMLGSCPLQVLSMVAFHSISIELIVLAGGLVAGGFFLTMWHPRLQDTTQALIVAMKYDNRLTAARLALEMDISFDKAEEIIQELVRSGVAEIDLDHNHPDQAITYEVRGL
jgi:hypothetical protein